MKVGFGKRGNANLGFDHHRDVEYVRSMREGIGADKALMIDLGVAVKWDVPTAVKRTQAFDEYDIAWIEEPLGAWDPAGYRDLRSKTKAAMAYGEREWNVEGFERVLATGTVDVIGCDPGRAEGITGFKRGVRRHRKVPTPSQRTLMVVRDRDRSQSRRELLDLGMQVVRVQAPGEPDATRARIPNPSPTSTAGSTLQRPIGLGIDIDESVVGRYRSERVLG